MSPATVAPPRPGRRFLLGGIGLLALWAGGCSSDKVSSVEVTSVTLRPATATLVVGETRRFSVDIRDQDGNAVPSTIVTWSASPASVVSVDETGLLRAEGTGSGTLRATAQGVTGTAAITVQPPPTIRVIPGSGALAGLIGGSPPPEPVDLAVENAGSGTLSGLFASVTYPPGSATGWLSPTLASTTAPTTLRLVAVSSGLNVGDYAATVTLSSSVAANSPLEIPVQLRIVADQPVIGATPSLVGFSGVSGGPRPPEQVVDVENIGGGELDDLQVGIVYDDMPGWLTATLSGPSDPAELTLEVDPAPLVAGTYRARARLTSAKALNSPKDVVVSFNVEARADLRVTKIGPDSAAAGTRVAYALQLRNEGPSAAESVVFTDTLPANADLVAVPQGATLSGGVLRWDLGTIQRGDQRSFSVEVDIPSAGVGVLRNAAAAASPTADPTPASRFAETVADLVRASDLEVRKVGPDSVFAGRQGTYDLVVVNRGPSDAVSVLVSDSLPAAATFVSAGAGGTESRGVVVWPVVPTLAAGDSLVFQTTVAVASDRSGTLVNTARAAAASRDPDPANDTAVVQTPIVVYADLEAVAAAPPTVTAGTPMTLTAGVRNLGPADAADVVVADTLPAGVVFVSATGGGTEAGGVVTWPSIPVLQPGDSARYDVVVDVPASAGGSLTHRVGVATTTADPGPAPDSASATTAVSTRADLAVAKSGPASDTAGTAADYTVVVRNDGPSDAVDVVVVDSLPAGAVLVTASDAGTAAAGVVTWPTVPLLAVGDSVIRTLRATLAPAATGSALNVARGAATTADPDTLDNRSAVSTALVTSADLGIAKSGPASAVAGQNATYTLTVSNAGPSTATGVVVTDTLPAGVTFVSATNGGTATGGVVTWPAATLAPGAVLPVQVTVLVAPARTAALTNVAAVTSPVSDPVATNNRATTSTPVQVSADVAVTKSGSATATAGTNTTWTVQVSNAGPSTATGVVVTDTLPAGVTFVSATGGGTATGNVVTWPTIATLAPGASASFSVTGAVGPSTSGALQNVAAVTTISPDPAAADNRATATVTVQASSDLGVVKTGPAVDTAGTPLTWTVQATNAGPSTAAGVVVTDTLPAGVTFVSATGGGTLSGNVVTWPTIPTLAVGAGTSFGVTVALAGTTSGTLQNVAAVRSTTPDPTATDNRATAATTVVAAADVSVAKTAQAVDTAGTTTSYGITVSNAGPSTATGVVVTDTLPAGVTFVSATGGGTLSGNVVTWPTIASLASGGNQAFTVTVAIGATTSGIVRNVAAVTSTTVDVSTANNRATAATTVVAAADLAMAKSAQAVDTAGTSTSYGVTVSNGGPSAATGVVVTDTLPAGVTFVSATGGGTLSGNVVTWPAIATLAAGANQAFTVNATLGPTTTGSIQNVAAATSATADPSTANNRATASTTVSAAADLAVAKTAQAVDTAGTATSYGITVSNTGPSTATGVVVTDTLPAGVTFVSATGGGTLSGNVVTWPTIATLASGANQAFTVNVTLGATTTGPIQNVAAATATTTDPSAANNRATASTTVLAAADVAVAKTAQAVDTAGTPTSYGITVSNAGPSTATGVVVTDTLPAGVTFVSATGGGTLAGNVVTWPTIATLASGASQAFTVNATVDATTSGSIQNVAAVRATSADPSAANNRSAASTTVVAAADVGVQKTAPAVDTAGTTITWTVTATNAGPSTATGVVVTDTLPAGVTFVSATGGGTLSGNVVTWPTIASLASGANQAFTLTANLGAAITGTLQNVAAVSSTTADPSAANNRVSASTTVVAAANVAVAKTAQAVDTAGTATSYGITVSNTGPSTATGVVVTDTLPAGVTFVSATGGGTLSGNVVTWPTIASLASGGNQAFTVNVTLGPTTTGSIQNVAAATSATADPSTANNRATASTTVAAVANVAVAKTAQAVDTAGTATSYGITVSNAGPSTATGVVVTDTLPAGVTFVSATGGGTLAGNVVTWPTIATLASGANQAFTVNATLGATTSGSIQNVAAATATSADPSTANNRATASTTVVAAADVAVVKTAQAVDTAGTSTSYGITVANAGPSTATGVVVTDTLPAGVTFVSATGGGTLSGNVVTWPTIASLASGANQAFTVNVTIGAGTTGALQNVAAATTTTADPSTANNRATASTTVVAAADVAVAKTAQAVDTAGTATSYGVTVSNTGPSTATGVVVTDTLPAGVTFVSATGGGTLSGNVVTWPTIASLASGANQAFTVNVTIGAGTTGTLQNVAAASSTTADPSAANNRATASTTVVAAANVAVAKTAQAVDTAGTATSYGITVSNTGPSTATGVVVTDTLPAGVTFVSATGGGTLSGNVVTWPTIASLASGGNQAFTVNATLGPTTTGSIQNVAAATATSADPSTANNRATASTTVVAAANVAVAKTAQAVDTAGTATSYGITVSNTGPSTATGVVVTDTLPAGVTFVSATGGGTLSGNVVTWPTIATLASGANQAFTVNATLAATTSGSIQNVAAATATSADPSTANNRATASTTVVAAADVSVAKTAPAVDTAGTASSYGITVANAGPSTATGVVVTDTLPAGVTFVSATGGGTLSGNVITWPTIASLASGANQAFTVNVTIGAGTTGALQNVAAATTTTADPSTANNRATASTTVAAVANVAVAKTAQAVDTAGTASAYGITVSNAGPSTATGVVVTDTLPAGVTFVSATGGGTLSGNVVTWPTIASLASGANQPFTVNVTLDPTTTGSIQNVAAATAATADPSTANNRATASTTVAAVANVAVAKTAQAVDTAGTATSYGITVSNTGPSTATGVVVTDTLPAGVTFVSATGGGTLSGNVVTWPTIATLASGANQAFTVNATLSATTSGSIQNVAAATAATADPSTANNRATASTTVVAAADVSVAKTAPAVDTAGTASSYGITVANAGPSTATGVVVTDTLPAGVTFVSATGGGTLSGNVVTWPTIASLASGANQAFTVNVTIGAGTSGTLQNVAAATSTTADPSPANNRTTASTTVGAAADVSVAKTAQPVDTAGTASAYGITVANAGPSPATGVVVTDTLPAGVTFVSATGGGTLSGNVVTWPTIASLASGANQAFTVNVTIGAGTTGSIQNVAAATATTADPSTANNRTTASTTVAAVADVGVAKTAQAVDTAGTATSYGVTVSNTGPSTATGVVVTDTLPAGVTFVSATGGGTLSGNVVTWPTLASLASGANQAFTVNVTIGAATTGSIQNVAAATAATADPSTANNRATASTTVAAAADLVAGASAPATAASGDQIIFTVSVANTGPSTATGVVVTDTLPTGVTFVSATGGGTLSGNVVTWPTLASLAPGAPATTFDVVVDIGGTFTGTLTNVVGVSGATADPTASNDQATSSTAVSTPAPVPEAAAPADAAPVRSPR